MLSLTVSKYKFSIILTRDKFCNILQFHFIFRHIFIVSFFLMKIPTQSCTLMDEIICNFKLSICWDARNTSISLPCLSQN